MGAVLACQSFVDHYRSESAFRVYCREQQQEQKPAWIEGLSDRPPWN
jgi:hypothetical protein